MLYFHVWLIHKIIKIKFHYRNTKLILPSGLEEEIHQKFFKIWDFKAENRSECKIHSVSRIQWKCKYTLDISTYRINFVVSQTFKIFFYWLLCTVRYMIGYFKLDLCSYKVS